MKGSFIFRDFTMKKQVKFHSVKKLLDQIYIMRNFAGLKDHESSYKKLTRC